MSDLGGLVAAYHAYKKDLRGCHKELPSLPGLNYTTDQQFWISFGASRCIAHNKASLIDDIGKDTHAPWQHRVNPVLQNTREFAKDFNCHLGSPMNPTKKCSVV